MGGVQNVVADALSRKHSLLSAMEVKVVGFETFKYPYENDVDLARYGRIVNQVPFNNFLSLMDFFFELMLYVFHLVL